jgi:hypothetical protein
MTRSWTGCPTHVDADDPWVSDTSRVISRGPARHLALIAWNAPALMVAPGVALPTSATVASWRGIHERRRPTELG